MTQDDKDEKSFLESIPVYTEDDAQEPQIDGIAPDQDTPPLLPRRSLKRGRGKSSSLLTRMLWLALCPVIFLTVYSTVGYVLIPYLIKTTVPAMISERIGRPVTFGSTDFDPYALRIVVNNGIIGPRLDDPEDKIDPVLSFRELAVNLELKSFVRAAVVSKSVQVDKFYAHIVRNSDSSYNIINLFQKLFESSGGEQGHFLVPFPFLFNNISISNSQVVFEDVPAGKTHAIKEMYLDLPILSNISANSERPAAEPETVVADSSPATDQYVNPRFSAVINGSKVEFTGKTKMVGRQLEAHIDLSLTDLDIPYYLAYLPMDKNVSIINGKADLDMDLIFASSPGAENSLSLQGGATLRNLWIQDAAGKAIAKIPATRLAGKFNPLQGSYAFREINFNEPEFIIERNDQGRWTFPFGVGKENTADAYAVMEKNLREFINAEGLTLSIGHLSVKNGKVSYVDQHVQGGYAEKWHTVHLSISSFTSRTATPAPFALTGRTEQDGRLSCQGKIVPHTMNVSGFLVLDNFNLVGLNPYLIATEGHRIKKGNASKFEARFTLGSSADNGRTDLQLQAVNMQLTDFIYSILDNEDFKTPKITMENGHLSLVGKECFFKSIKALQPTLTIKKDAAGQLNWHNFFSSADKSAPAEKSWTIEMDTVAFEATEIIISDLGINMKEPILKLLDADIVASALSNRPANSGTMKLTARTPEGSRFDLTGILSLKPISASLDGEISDLPAGEVSMFVEKLFRVRMTGGLIQARGTLTFPKLSFSGAVRATDVSAGNDKEINRLAADSIDAEEFYISLSPRTLKARIATLHAPRFKWDLADPNNFFNTIFQPPPPEAETDEESETDLQFQTLVISDGRLQITDRTLEPEFSALTTSIDAKIDNLHNKEGSQSTFTAKGFFHDSPADPQPGEFTLTGAASLFDTPQSLHCIAHLDKVALTTLSPYLVDHTGYTISSGTLQISTDLRLTGTHLQAENILQTKDMNLGKSVSDNIHTPLAIALLTDPSGKLMINIPVEGDIRNESFTYRSDLARGLRSLLLKTAVSPFALLSPITAGQSSIDYITFQPGRPFWSDDQQKRLNELAHILEQRPWLKVNIKGFVDEEKDRRGLLQIKQAIAEQKQRDREAEMLEEMTGKYEQEEIKPNGTTSAGEPIVQEILPADPPPVRVSDSELNTLARERAGAVKQFLIGKGIDQKRLFLESPDIITEKGLLNRPGNRADINLGTMRKQQR